MKMMKALSEDSIREEFRGTISHFKDGNKFPNGNSRLFAFHSDDFPQLIDFLVANKSRLGWIRKQKTGIDYDWLIEFGDDLGPTYMRLKYSEQIIN